MVLVVTKFNRIWTNVAALSAAGRKNSNVSTATKDAAPTNQTLKDEITPAMIRTLYRDFVHIVKVQQKQPKTKPTMPVNPLHQIREEFRQPLSNNTSTTHTASTASTVEARYQHGINRFAFLRMNTTHYKPRTYNHTNTGSDNGTERYIYKNGQRFQLHSIGKDATFRNNQRGYVVSPYDGKNLDPESVTKHRKNLRRAGFVNNEHAKGIF